MRMNLECAASLVECKYDIPLFKRVSMGIATASCGIIRRCRFMCALSFISISRRQWQLLHAFPARFCCFCSFYGSRCYHYAAPSSSSSSRSPHPDSVTFRHSVSAKAHASPVPFPLYFFVFYESLVKWLVYRNLRFIICKMQLKSGLCLGTNWKREPQSCVCEFAYHLLSRWHLIKVVSFMLSWEGRECVACARYTYLLSWLSPA